MLALGVPARRVAVGGGTLPHRAGLLAHARAARLVAGPERWGVCWIVIQVAVWERRGTRQGRGSVAEVEGDGDSFVALDSCLPLIVEGNRVPHGGAQRGSGGTGAGCAFQGVGGADFAAGFAASGGAAEA
jgi:hypothetical protein